VQAAPMPGGVIGAAAAWAEGLLAVPPASDAQHRAMGAGHGDKLALDRDRPLHCCDGDVPHSRGSQCVRSHAGAGLAVSVPLLC